jgi:hypothetical protein
LAGVGLGHRDPIHYGELVAVLSPTGYRPLRQDGRQVDSVYTMTAMRFGLFVPQGWRHDHVGIEPAEQWCTMRDLATRVDRKAVGFSSIWAAGPGASWITP